MAFPTSPSDNQEYTAANGTRYRYDAATDSWIKIAQQGNTDATAKAYSQTGFSGSDVGAAVRFDIATQNWVKAIATSAENSEVAGIISAADASEITVVTNGYISGLSSLTAGEVYRLSETVAGGLTKDDCPIGSYNKPVLLAISATEGIVLNQTGYLVGADSPDWKDGKNVIINGDMRIWQRGTSWTNNTGSKYTNDRFRMGNSGSANTATLDLSRNTDVPNNQFQYSMDISINTADSDMGNDGWMAYEHRIEGYNFRKFVGQTATLSFWIKSNEPGTYTISLANAPTADAFWYKSFAIDTADTWEKKTITITFDYGAVGSTWDYTNGIGLIMYLVLDAGSNYRTTATEELWTSTPTYPVANGNVTFASDTAHYLRTTGWQLELGEEATDFEFLDHETQLSKCERYYWKSYDYGVYAGAADFGGSFGTRCVSGGSWSISVEYGSEMRTNPTVNYYAPSTGTQGVAYNINTSSNIGLSNTGPGNKGQTVRSGTAASTGQRIHVHIVADAEL